MKAEYYQIIVTCTSKEYGPNKESYCCFDRFEKTFDTWAKLCSWLKEHYGNCKRQKMFCDDENGKSQQIGWVYCFNNADWSHAPVEKWRQQDWVEVRKITAIPAF